MDATNPRPLAVITDASSGVGDELARQFSDYGYDLIFAAENDVTSTAAAQLADDTRRSARPEEDRASAVTRIQAVK